MAGRFINNWPANHSSAREHERGLPPPVLARPFDGERRAGRPLSRLRRSGGHPSRGLPPGAHAPGARVSEGWWAHQDSNLGQAGYEPAALTAELWARGNGKWQTANPLGPAFEERAQLAAARRGA